MPDQKHLFDKVTLHLSLEKEEGHFAVQERWARVFKKEVAPALSDYFDRLVPPGEVWQVGRLSVDLGVVSASVSDAELAGLITQQVIGALEKYRITANGQLRKIPVAMAELEALVFYIKNGYLPDRALNMEVAVVFRKNIKNNFSALLAAFDKGGAFSTAEAEVVAKRMAWQFPEKDLQLFLKKYICEIGWKGLNGLPDLYASLKDVEREYADRVGELFWIVFFKIIFYKKPERGKFVDMFFQNYFYEIKKSNIPLFVFKKIKNNWPKKAKDVFEKIITPGRNIFLKEEKKELIKEGEERLREDAGPQKGVFCKNTGVVLLHPFLPRFFQSIGLTGEKEKVFQNNKKRSGAVHWLHYMATGETRASEEELTFQKFLCGLRITEPLPPVSIDDKKHLAMADDMLRAVIEHWKALKNTSPDGLREGFLQRSGRLTQKQNGYLLQPENKTQDILLGQLPWGLSVVRLPWMEHTLWVEW